MPYNAINSLQNLITNTTYEREVVANKQNHKSQKDETTEKFDKLDTFPRENSTWDKNGHVLVIPNPEPVSRHQNIPKVHKRASYKYSALITKNAQANHQDLLTSRKRSAECISTKTGLDFEVPQKQKRSTKNDLVSQTNRIGHSGDNFSQNCRHEEVETEKSPNQSESKPGGHVNCSIEKSPGSCSSVEIVNETSFIKLKKVDFTQVLKRASLIKESNLRSEANKYNSSKFDRQNEKTKKSILQSGASQILEKPNRVEKNFATQSLSEISPNGSKNFQTVDLGRSCTSPIVCHVVPDLSKIVTSAKVKQQIVDSYSDFVSKVQFVPYVRKTKSEAEKSAALSSKEPKFETLPDDFFEFLADKSKSFDVGAQMEEPHRQKTAIHNSKTYDDTSSSRILPLSDQALTQAHLLGLALSKPSTNRKSSYAVDFKLCVVEWLVENNMNMAATAEKFQINRKQVYSWYKDREKLRLWAAKNINAGSNSKGPTRRLVNKGKEALQFPFYI